MIKAVIFDLDDTLISENEYIISGYRHISILLSKKFGIEKDFILSLMLDLHQTSSKKVFNRLLEKLNIESNEIFIWELVEEYRTHMPEIEFYADVHPCLEKLKERAIKTGIITDGYIFAQRNKLKVLNADKYFDYIILTEEIGREYWKPHPKAFEKMREMLEVEFNEMIYVGDNPEKDFIIAKDYPLTCIRIDRPMGLYSKSLYRKDFKEKYRINHLNELINFIDR